MAESETEGPRLDPGLIITVAARLNAGQSFEDFFAEGHKGVSDLSQEELAELKRQAKLEAAHPRF